MNKSLMLISMLAILLLAGAASANSVTYGNGWQKECYSDGKCAYSNHPTYLRWDNQWIPEEWLNISNGNWSYKIDDLPTRMNFTADNRTISIPKANTKFDMSLFKISPSLTYTKTALLNNMVSVNITVAYLTFPYSLSQIKDYADEHNIKVGRWMFQAGQEHIEIYDDVTTLNKSAYQFRIVNDEIRLYFLKAEANKMSGNITFELKSWIVGEGGNAWTGNSSKDNTTLNRDTNRIFLRQEVYDYISYWRFDGSSGTVSYDENTTGNNNGTLTNMNTGLNNGTSGWNSSGKFGNALRFDGTNDYVTIPDSNSLDITTNITLSSWIKLNSVTAANERTIIRKYGLNLENYDFDITTGGNLQFVYNNNGWVIIDSLYTIPDTNWHYVAMTFKLSASNVCFYDNGILVSTKPIVENLVVNNVPLGIGATGSGSNPFNGLIDNVQIYNRALTNDEINQTMNNTMKASGNLTTWYDAGTGNETYQIDVNATTDANSNYTVWYANNGSTYSQLGGTLTGNNSLSITTKYQNTDVQVRLAGNTTSTPELIKVTFWTQTASVGDTTAPTYSDASHNQTTAGQPTLFSIQYNDTTALHPNGQYIFSTNNTGTWVNDSAVNWTATPQWANVSKTLNSTVGAVIGYRWYAFDNANNWNNTPIYTLTVQSAAVAGNIVYSYVNTFRSYRSGVEG